MKVTPRLAIAHNIRPDGLKFASEIGGLICPSIAVIRTDHEFENFGEITLLIDKSKINLRQNPAHNADVFTVRFPTCYYKTDSRIFNEFEQFIDKSVPEMKNIKSKADCIERNIIEGGFDKTCKCLSDDLKVLLAYARSHDKNPRIYRTEHKSGVNFIDSMPNEKALLRELEKLNFTSITSTHPNYMEASAILYKQFKRNLERVATGKGGTELEIKEDTQYLIDSFSRHHFTFDGDKPLVKLGTLNKVSMHMVNISKDPNPIDAHKTKDKLSKQIQKPAQLNHFKEWLGSHISHGFISPYMNIKTQSGNYKKLAFTAENVMKAIKGKGNGAEKTIFMGAGSIRSLVAKRLSSFREIENNMDKLCSKDEMKQVRTNLDNQCSDLPEKLAPYYLYRTDTFLYRDAVYEEISEYARNRNVRALQSFKNIDPDVITEINTFLNRLSNAKTQYFEIKSTKILELSEFDAAIVPKGTSKDVIQILQANNINITLYDSDIKHDRLRALNKNQDLFFGQGRTVELKTEENVALAM